MHDNQHIALDSEQSPLCIAPENVYFAFSSGRFTYDCQTCGAQCCRGYGYDTRGDLELTTQIDFYPNLRFFLEAPAGARTYRVLNSPPNCFFLTEDNLCDIHAQLGSAAKPETCRLFPFNSFRRIGQYLIVNLHPSLCPLGVTPDGVHDPKSEHEQLLDAMRVRAIGGAIPEAVTPGVDCAVAIDLERRIQRMSVEHLTDSSYLFFASKQLAATRQAGADATPDSESTDPRHISEDVLMFLGHLHDVLATDADQANRIDQDPSRVITAMTPSFRAKFLFPKKTPDELRRAVAADLTPYAMLVLDALLRLMPGEQRIRITCQTVGRVFESSGALLRLLAHLDTVMVWRTGDLVDLRWGRMADSGERFIRIAKALLPRVQRERRWPLWRVLCEHLPNGKLERMVFLRMLSELLNEHIVPIDRPILFARVGQRTRAAVQHWALQHMTTEVIVKLSQQRTRRSKPGLD